MANINKHTKSLTLMVGSAITELMNLKQTDYVNICNNETNTLVLMDASLNSGKDISFAR